MTTSAGYSGTPLPQKLGIKAGHRLAILGAPEGFDQTLGRLPEAVAARRQARGRVDVVVFFTTRLDELARRFEALSRTIEANGGLWIAWPKRASGVATDLDENVVRDVGLAAGLVDNKVCAIDATWSGLRFVHRVENRKGLEQAARTTNSTRAGARPPR